MNLLTKIQAADPFTIRHPPLPYEDENVTNTIQESYTDVVQKLRDLGDALIPATAAQFEAPPRASVAKEPVSESKGIPNPTFDITSDPRRWELSREIDLTAQALRQASATLGPHIYALRRAVARWEGYEGDEAA